MSMASSFLMLIGAITVVKFIHDNYKLVRREEDDTVNYIVRTVYYDSRDEAEDILENLQNIVNKYGYVTLDDYYNLIGEISDYSDAQYGWRNLNFILIKKVRTQKGPKWVIRFPEVTRITIDKNS